MQADTGAAADTGRDPEPGQAAAIGEPAPAATREAAQLVPGAIGEGGSGLSSLQAGSEPGEAQQMKDRTSKIIDALKIIEEAAAEFDAETMQAMQEGSIDPAKIRAKRKELEQLAEQLGNPLQTLLNSLQGAYLQLEEGEQEPENPILQGQAQFMESAKAMKIYTTLLPFMDEELEANPKIGKEPLDFLMAAAARRARAAGIEIPHLKAEDTAIPRLMVKKVDAMGFPLDKPNSKIWKQLEEAETNGQFQLMIETTRKGGKENEALIYYALSFEAAEKRGIKITKRLTPKEKRLYCLADSLYRAGNPIFTATQLYKIGNNNRRPNAKDIKEINDLLDKMSYAHITVDNSTEAAAYANYKRFQYDGALLPFERVRAYENGVLVESAIHLFREPPMMTFARERGQVTAIPVKVLDSPISKTDANIALEDYLLERISHIKNPKSKVPNKILYSTIYENCDITTAKQRSRLPGRVERYLKHYKECDFIKGYVMGEDGVTVYTEHNLQEPAPAPAAAGTR